MATATKEQIIGIIMDEIKSFDYRDYYKCTQALSEKHWIMLLSKIPKEFLTEQVEEFYRKHQSSIFIRNAIYAKCGMHS